MRMLTFLAVVTACASASAGCSAPPVVSRAPGPAEPSSAPSSSASSSSAAAQPASLPTLGLNWGRNSAGYGQVKPSLVSNGGDASGEIRDVTWRNWGESTAEGEGLASYVAPGDALAAGKEEQARVVAYRLGTCQGRPAYRAVKWYFPQHGEKFQPDPPLLDACTGS